MTKNLNKVNLFSWKNRNNRILLKEILMKTIKCLKIFIINNKFS